MFNNIFSYCNLQEDLKRFVINLLLHFLLHLILFRVSTIKKIFYLFTYALVRDMLYVY